MSLEDFHEVSIKMPWGQLAGRWYGDQMQRPIVGLHGWLDNCGTFGRLAPLLSRYTSLLCIDFPGHGYSTHLPNGIVYHNLEYVRTLLYLMKAYKWDKISILGHSMGGIIAFIFASFYPDRIDMIVSLDIIKLNYFPTELEPIVIHHIIERALIDNERRLLINEPPAYSYDDCVRLLYEATEYSVNIENCKYLLERNVTKSQKYPDKYYFSRDARLKSISQFNPTAEMTEVMIMRICRYEIPYLVIKGAASTNESAATIPEIAKLFEKLNRNFELHVIENATHHLHLNNPHEVAEKILDFWYRKNWRNNESQAKSIESDFKEISKSKL